MPLDPSEFRIRFDTIAPLLPDDPHDYIREIDGTLNIFDEDLEEFSIPVGRVSAYKVEIALAAQAKEPILFVFDSVNDELSDYFSNLFDEDDFSSEIQSMLEPASGRDLLIIDRVEIDPEFRGKNLGLIAAMKTIETFSGGCAYVTLRPCPLQFGLYRNDAKKLKTLKYDEFEKTESRARKRLQKYWGQLGFKQIRDTDVFILSTAYNLPTSASKLCRRAGE